MPQEVKTHKDVKILEAITVLEGLVGAYTSGDDISCKIFLKAVAEVVPFPNTVLKNCNKNPDNSNIYSTLGELTEKNITYLLKTIKDCCENQSKTAEYSKILKKLSNQFNNVKPNNSSTYDTYTDLLKKADITSAIDLLTRLVEAYETQNEEAYSGILMELATKGKEGKIPLNRVLMSCNENPENANIYNSISELVENNIKHLIKNTYQCFLTQKINSADDHEKYDKVKRLSERFDNLIKQKERESTELSQAGFYKDLGILFCAHRDFQNKDYKKSKGLFDKYFPNSFIEHYIDSSHDSYMENIELNLKNFLAKLDAQLSLETIKTIAVPKGLKSFTAIGAYIAASLGIITEHDDAHMQEQFRDLNKQLNDQNYKLDFPDKLSFCEDGESISVDNKSKIRVLDESEFGSVSLEITRQAELHHTKYVGKRSDEVISTKIDIQPNGHVKYTNTTNIIYPRVKIVNNNPQPRTEIIEEKVDAPPSFYQKHKSKIWLASASLFVSAVTIAAVFTGVAFVAGSLAAAAVVTSVVVLAAGTVAGGTGVVAHNQSAENQEEDGFVQKENEIIISSEDAIDAANNITEDNLKPPQYDKLMEEVHRLLAETENFEKKIEELKDEKTKKSHHGSPIGKGVFIQPVPKNLVDKTAPTPTPIPIPGQ